MRGLELASGGRAALVRGSVGGRGGAGVAGEVDAQVGRGAQTAAVLEVCSW